MWERPDRSARAAREFASVHHLSYSGSAPAESSPVVESLPFAVSSLRHCVRGDWRGRSVQRFETGRYTVELMEMPVPLPTLHVIPLGLDRGALALRGKVTSTGDTAFDRRWSLFTDDPEFAAALLTPSMREALMHPAADGRAVTFSGDQVSSWAYGESSWHDARVRLEFLAVVVGRVAPEVLQRFAPPAAAVERVEERLEERVAERVAERVEYLPPVQPVQPVEESVWVPAAEQSIETPMWEVARMPEPANTRQGDQLSDTGEFQVALLQASLEGTAFLPQPESAVDDVQAMWRIAPVSR